MAGIESRAQIDPRVYDFSAKAMRLELLNGAYPDLKQKMKLRQKLHHGHRHALLATVYAAKFPEKFFAMIPDGSLTDVQVGCMYHDVGSPINLMTDQVQFDHPVVSWVLYRALTWELQMPFGWPADLIIWNHHKKNNGTGHPPEQLPYEQFKPYLSSNISMLVQIVDKLVSGCEGRSYNPPKSLRQIYDELLRRPEELDSGLIHDFGDIFDEIFIDSDYQRLKQLGLGQLHFMASWK